MLSNSLYNHKKPSTSENCVLEVSWGAGVDEVLGVHYERNQKKE